ncbi:MAG: hypothetical protein ACKVQT_19855 [Burkholderiales bacterium]
MNARLPMYEGDGFIRQGLSQPIDNGIAVEPTNPLSQPNFEALMQLEKEARRLRSEHATKLIQSMIGWIRDIPRRARQASAERYLAGASDHADVERRIRNLERNHAGQWNRRLTA